MRICGFSTCVCLQVYSSASPLRLGPQRVGLAFASDAASGCKPEFSEMRLRFRLLREYVPEGCIYPRASKCIQRKDLATCT